MKQSCRRRRLAAEGSLAADACSCGTFHVSIGAVTLRLSPAGLASLQALIATASTEWERAARDARGEDDETEGPARLPEGVSVH